jgi:hypothetical protein
VEDLERPVFRYVGGDLRQSGDEAGVAHELRRDAVVWMARSRHGAESGG